MLTIICTAIHRGGKPWLISAESIILTQVQPVGNRRLECGSNSSPPDEKWHTLHTELLLPVAVRISCLFLPLPSLLLIQHFSLLKKNSSWQLNPNTFHIFSIATIDNILQFSPSSSKCFKIVQTLHHRDYQDEPRYMTDIICSQASALMELELFVRIQFFLLIV